MNVKITEEFIRELPKTELHCHLDGSLRLNTILELAEKDKVDLPTRDPDMLRKAVTVQSNGITLPEYIKKFDLTLKVLQTPESLTRTAFELAEDCSKENVLYLEVRYSPILHTKQGMTTMESVDAVIKGLKQAEEEFKIKTGIIICGIRSISPEVSYQLAELAVAFKNRGVVGFDLAGVEENFPAKDHKEAFYLILDNNINTTLHAGEDFGPESIHQAVHYCGAHRIGHGVRLKEDGDLLNYITDHRIAMEICMTSNIHTGSVKSYENHPFKFYYDYGLRVTLNTDNRLISNTCLTKEYMLAHQYFNFKILDFKEIIINGFKSAFLPHRDRTNMIRRIADELDTFVSV
ncbi:adenosine deaminase [bacterium]|nr:adenosine deaminase [bacterium]MBU1064589.1 adenosine deaminase [bacterium]MBU1633624.1 adenosine deaminase [bacterium]MBU1874960.1 adenosine deaminase [bacterium]